jgi:HAD superfamily hydrolase (TIGR01484 family)
MAQDIINSLNLKDPCILSGGTQIIDPKKGKTLWETHLILSQVKEVIAICMPYAYEIFFSDETVGSPAINKHIKGPERIIYVKDCKKEDAEKIRRNVLGVKNISAHFAGSWTKDRVDIHITHATATKKQAVNELINILGIKKEGVLVVGDSGNDLPLFESAGFKVAMDNATEDLKKVADYIAPPVEEDGLAYVIQKFILDS